MNTVQKKIT